MEGAAATFHHLATKTWFGAMSLAALLIAAL